MFLVENVNSFNRTNNEFSNITADPSCGYEIIMECEDTINKLSMAMIKLEHKAIMNEDANLLNEGIKEFGGKVADTLKRAGQKFLVFLEKTIVAWTNLQAKLSTMFLSTDKVQEMINNSKSGKIKIKGNISKAFDAIKKIQQNVNDLVNVSGMHATTVKGDDFDDKNYHEKGIAKGGAKMLSNEIDKFASEGESVVTTQAIQSALNFIKSGRTIVIAKLKDARNRYKTTLKEAIKEAEKGDHEKAKQLTAWQRNTNALIIATNKATTYCAKICRKALKGEDVEEKEGNAKVQNESFGILDNFM
jgi:hypothetical protein